MTSIRFHKLLLGIVLVLTVLVLTVHVILPMIFLQQINQRMHTIPGYDGQVEALGLGWLTPSLTVHDFKLAKRDKKAPGAVVSIESVEVRFFWKELLRGRLVLNITLEKPNMLFLMRERRVGQARPCGVWRIPFERFPAFRVNRMALQDGILRFKNDDALPPIDVSFDAVDLTATSVANSAALAGRGPVTVQGHARMQHHAPLSLELSANPFCEHAEFDIQGTLTDFNLTVMNPIVRYYTGLELEKGVLNMRLHLRVRSGAFQGRVERTIDHLTIKKTGRGVLKMIKENIAQAWLSGREDPKTDRFEKEFEYAGPLGYLDQDTVLAAVWVAKGAFIQALKVNLKDEVHPVLPEQALDQWAEFQAKQRKKAGRSD